MSESCFKAPPLTFSWKASDFFCPNNFAKTPMNDWLEKVFISLVSQIIIASAGQLSKCYRKSTVIAFRILVKSLIEFCNCKVTVSNFNKRELHQKRFPINLAKFFQIATLKMICKRLLLQEKLVKSKSESKHG